MRIGSVRNATPRGAFNRGNLVLDDHNSADVAAIAAVVGLAQRVDAALDAGWTEEYLAAWQKWKNGCDEIQELGIWIGNSVDPVETFSIGSDWSVEWQDMSCEESL